MIGVVRTNHQICGHFARPRARGARHMREQDRVVLFLDLCNSTGITEQLGNRAFAHFLQHTLDGAAAPIVRCGGEIQRHGGDALIATWPTDIARAEPRCLECPFAIIDSIEEQRHAFERTYGTTPCFRFGMHAGSLIATDGRVRREPLLIGDVMNTTSRIVDFCRESRRGYLVSSTVIAELPLSSNLCASSIGNVNLRGKTGCLELFAIERRTC